METFSELLQMFLAEELGNYKGHAIKAHQFSAWNVFMEVGILFEGQCRIMLVEMYSQHLLSPMVNIWLIYY